LEKTLGSDRHIALVNFLIARRKAAGLTQAELAKLLGEYQSYVARIESGQRRIDVVELLDIAKALNFDATKAVKRIENFNSY
jgi:transcriptional regulator with XRE-family HTH domain